MNVPKLTKDAIDVITEKKEAVPPIRSRSEYTLLWELIQRNPKKSLEFLKRLAAAKGIAKAQDVVVEL